MATKKVIKPMSESDVVEEHGTVKSAITRAVKINDTMQNLTVVRSLNHKKGSFEIHVKINMNAITGDDVKDTATLDTFSKMIIYQRNKCLKWRDDWKNENTSDENQMGMGFKDED